MRGLFNKFAKKQYHPYFFLGIIISAAFAVRLYFMRYHPVMVPDYDGADYLGLAQNVFKGRPFYHIFIPPGFPLILSLALPFFTGMQQAGMFVSALFGSALCAAVFLLARELFGEKTGFAAAALTAFTGQLVQVSTWVMSEMSFAFFLYLGLYFAAVFNRRRDIRTAAAMGVIFGLDYLIRPEGLIFLAGACAALLLSGFISGPSQKKVYLMSLALSLVIALAIAFPYLLYLREALGRWSLSGKVLYNLSGNAGADAAGYLGGHAGELWAKFLHNFPLLIVQFRKLFSLPVIILALAGMLLSLVKARRRPAAFLLPALLAGYVLLLPFFFVDDRILTPYLPAVLIYSVYLVVFLGETLSKYRRVFQFHPLAAVFVLTFSLFQIKGLHSYLNTNDFFQVTSFLKERYLVTGKWIQINTCPGDKILSRELLLVFYSGRDYINLPNISPGELARFAREKGARYIITDDNCVRKRQNLGPLLDPWVTGNFYGDFGAFRIAYADPAAGVLIYELEGPS